MAYTTVKLERKNAVGLITIQRPDVLNAFNAELVDEMDQVTQEVAGDSSVRVVVLTGEGRGFSAGADLSERNPRWNSTEQALMQGYRPSLERIMTMAKPVIAAVNGPAAGVGAAFAMACDLCVMSEKAYIMLAFSNIALVPDGGANWLLPRTIGYRRAYQAAIEAEKITADRCLEWGLANRIAEPENLIDETLAWAEELAQRPPQSLSLTKELMRYAADAPYNEVYRLEAVRQNALIGSPDNQEGVAAFIEKRKPNFQGS